MRRLISPAGDQPRTRLPQRLDARVGARSSCAARAVKGTTPHAPFGPYLLSRPVTGACIAPELPDFGCHPCHCRPRPDRPTTDLPGEEISPGLGLLHEGRGISRLPVSACACVPDGSGSSPPESDLATAPATPPAGAVSCLRAAFSTPLAVDPVCPQHRRVPPHVVAPSASVPRRRGGGVPADHVALISRDPELTAEVRRLCAVAGRQLVTPTSGGDVARACRAAALVVVDCDEVDTVSSVAAELPGEVVLVARDLANVDPWRSAVRIGARDVLTLPVDTAQLLDRLALSAEQPGPAGPLLGVVGGRGGAGASTIAIAVAWALAERGRDVTLADFDALGGGLDVALGLERAVGVRWPDLAAARGVVPSAELRERLPRVGGLSVVSASNERTSNAHHRNVAGVAAALAVVDAARRGGGVVVADLPRWTDETAEAVMARCGVVALVVPADVRSVTAAIGLVRRVRSLCDDVRLVVRADARSRLRERDVAAALDCAPIAVITTDPGLTAAADRGELVASLRRSRLGRSIRRMADLLVHDG